MKNLGPILNVVLLIAVGVLFYMQFSSNCCSAEPAGEAVPTTEPQEESAEATTADGEFMVAILNMDTIQEQFQMMLDLEKQLTAKQKATINRLEATQRGIEQEMMELQQKAQSGMASETELAAKYQELQDRGGRFEQNRVAEEERLYKMQDDLTKDLRNTMNDYLDRYNKDGQYDLILRYGEVSEIFQHKGATDITSDVVTGLNEEYAASQATPAE